MIILTFISTIWAIPTSLLLIVLLIILWKKWPKETLVISIALVWIMSSSSLIIEISINSIGAWMTLAALLMIILIEGENEKDQLAIIILGTIGTVIMLEAKELLTLYLGIELQSIAWYILSGWKRGELYSAEAGLKYFVLGALASGLFLFGVATIYGATGLVELMDIKLYSESLSKTNGQDPTFIIGLIFIIIALLFKVGAAPFHMWVPDIYHGAPTIITGVFAILPKLALFIIIAEIIGSKQVGMIIICAAIASMYIGALGGMRQNNMKRLMGYSAIGHTGHILLGLWVCSTAGIASMIIYTIIYIVSTGTVFAILMTNKNFRYVVGSSGVARSNPLLAVAYAIALLSLAGIPPLAGFITKLYIYESLVDGGQAIVAFIAIVASVISAYYYIRVVKWLYFKTSKVDHAMVIMNTIMNRSNLRPNKASGIVISITTYIIIVFIGCPGWMSRVGQIAGLYYSL